MIDWGFFKVAAILILLIAAAAGILLFLSQRGTSAILSDTVCKPPCWNGILPGETKTWQAVDILIDTPNIYGIQETGNEQERAIRWIFRYPIKESGGYIYPIDDLVGAISFQTYGSLSLGEAFDLLGDPGYFWIRYQENEWRHWIEVEFVYPSEGYSVRADIDLPNEVKYPSISINQDSPVGRVIYFNPEIYTKLIASRILFREDEDTIEKNLQSWNGYGEISINKAMKSK